MTNARLATLDDVPALNAALAAADRLAIDTEFHAERRYVPALYLVQIHLPDGTTWILDPLIDGLLSAVSEGLKATPWILHGGRWDMIVLHVALGGLPSRILDTQIGAGLCTEWFPAPYAALVRDHLGRDVDKSATLSDWSRRPLSADQLAYAAADVDELFPLWDAIAAKLEAAGRLELAYGACDEARQQAIDPPSPDTAWRGIGARASLPPEGLAVLREVASWRRERAISRNQPERSVLSDGALIEIAKRRPRTAEVLGANRRMPRSIQKSPDEILALIARALDRPEDAWPRTVQRRTSEWHRLSWLEVWASASGVRGGFSPALVLPRSVLEMVVLAPTPDAAGACLTPWRRPLVAEALSDALGGRISLVLDDGDLTLREHLRKNLHEQ